MDKQELEDNIVKLWAKLETEPRGVTRSISNFDPCYMLMSDEGTISFFIRFSNTISTRVENKSYKNLSVKRIRLDRQQDAIVVSLSVPSFRSTFSIIASDVLYWSSQASNSSVKVNLFCERLFIWSNIFSKGKEEKLSENEQIGLYGELSFLKEMMDSCPNISITDIVYAWKGANKEDKDFIYKNHAIEVKSSSKQDGLVTISNIRQLDSTGLALLFLYHYCFAKNEGGPNTLPVLIQQLRNDLIGTPALDIFEESLIKAYYLDSDAIYYTKSYTIVSEDAYSVNASFPKIVSTNLPDIVDASYIINLASANCISCMINTNDLLDIINKA